MKKKLGFTLIELILSIAIGSLILIVTVNVFSLGINTNNWSNTEFSNQSEIRYSIESINNAIRFSTAAFSVTEADYKPVMDAAGVVTSGLAPNWDYIGLNGTKDKLMHFMYDGNKHVAKTLAEALPGSIFNIRFIKENPTQADGLVKFILEGYNEKGKKFNITTELDALNAINVVDWGDTNKVAVALAYRTDATPEIGKRPLGTMAIVLDTSGSMTLTVDGGGSDNDSNPPNNSRIRILQRSLTKMNGELRESGNIYASFIPFSTNANVPHENFNKPPKNPSAFREVKRLEVGKTDDWEKLINSLTAKNGTNTGDGMRRGYYQLLDFNNRSDMQDREIKNYMIIMVDGVSTMASVDIFTDANYRFVRGNKNVTDDWYQNNLGSESPSGTVRQYGYGRIIGAGNALDARATAYVKKVGNDLILAKSLPSGAKDLKLNGNVFVIGFSGRNADLQSVKDIARAVGIPVAPDNTDVNNDFINNNRVYIARTEDALSGVFSEIGGIIMEELWQVEGPKLK